MANRGKELQIGGGSRRPSQARAEDRARRSRRRADARREMSYADYLLAEPAAADFSREPAMVAMGLLHSAAWEFGRELRKLGRRVEVGP